MEYKTDIPNLQDLIRDSIGGEVVEQKAESLLPPGENYGSLMYKVDFKVKRGNKEEEYHGVAKCTPPNEATQKMIMTQVTFKSEIGWYTTVIPTLKQFRRDQGVQNEIDFFQPFYGARISLDPDSDMVDLDAVILTQNLKYLGYFNEDRHIGFNTHTTLAILRNLATFHAVPLALKIQNLELFNKKIKPFLPVFPDLSENMGSYNKQLFAVYDQIPECQPIMERIKKNINGNSYFSPRPITEPWTTVVHTDLWINNIMVTEGKNPKTMFLDLQVPGLGSPAADLVLFLLTSVKLDIISEKFDDFVLFYHEEFVKNLRELNISTNNYSFEGFIEEVATEATKNMFANAVGHALIIMGDKGKAYFDSPDGSFKEEENENLVANAKQIEKFRWLAFEAVKRKWI